MNQLARFRRTQRISGRTAFRQLFQEGVTVRNEWLALTAKPNGLKVKRFGGTVRREAAPAAVLRNRWKRWLRESFRENQEKFPSSMDLLATIRRVPPHPSFGFLERSLIELAQRRELCLKGSGSIGGSD